MPALRRTPFSGWTLSLTLAACASGAAPDAPPGEGGTRPQADATWIVPPEGERLDGGRWRPDIAPDAVSPPVEPPTEPPVEPTTAAPTEPPTAAPTDPPTAATTAPPTNPPTAAPTDPPTAPPTEPPTAAPPAVDIDEAAWVAGDFSAGVPGVRACGALPGGGEGPPMIVSNNPEAFDGPGLLMGTARPTVTRGGREYRLRGEFGLYFHHLYRGQGQVYVQVIVTNPSAGPVSLSAWGDAWTQGEAGGVALGASPDYRVSRSWITDAPRTRVDVEIPVQRPVRIWSGALSTNREVDGRFGFSASDDVYVYVVATPNNDLNEAVNLSRQDAPGDYRISGTPPPPFGREAGVYENDTWRADFSVGVPAAGQRHALIVNTATGGGHPQVQAFPALMTLEGSAQEAVGMYGNVYDLTVRLTNRDPAAARRVRLQFASLAQGNLSRYWDGAALLDERVVDVRHTPDDRTTDLADVRLAPGEARAVRLRAMVPGLTSIPQALLFESLPP